MSKSITYEVTVNQHATTWKLNGNHHREDGPACEYANGDKVWCLNGKRHREDGPAIERAEGNKFWYINNQLHREDGPAIEYADGTKELYINDELLTEDEFNHHTNPVVEMTIAEIEQLIGKRVKVVK